MRFRALFATAGLIAASVLPPAARAEEEDGYRHGRVRFVESGVTLHRATEVTAEEALPNLPFLPGDRIWSDASGRVEFQFPDGTLVRLDSRSKLDYSGHEEGRDERIVLRLWSGSLIARVRTPEAAHFEIETPAGSVELLDQAMVRVDVESGEARVSAYRGEAVVDDGRERVRLSAGERTLVRWGGAAAEAEPFDISPEDDFARWDEERESEERWASRSSEYLPDELDPYAGELERNGSWRYEAPVGYVWSPRVAAGWSPYANGYWSWTPYGWTWVPYESWGWAPFHYGRWGFSVGLGWYWSTGRRWGPGWVSWGVGRGYVGWCPLGYRDRPVYAWGGWSGASRGFRGSRGYGGWQVVRDGDFGHRDVAQRRLSLSAVDPGSLRVAESPNLRPTRNAQSLVVSNPTARAISRRPTPGDFVRELAVDNKTTIPSPWLRRGRTRVGETGVRETQDQSTGARPRRSTIDSGSGAQAGSGSDGAAEPRGRSASRPRSAPALPWYAPRSEGGTPRSEARAPEARAPRQRDVEAFRRGETSGRRDEAGAYRPRAERPTGSVREETEPRPRSSRPRQEASREESQGGQARYRSSSPRRDDNNAYRPQAPREERSYRPQAPREERPARDYSRSEPRTPRAESSSRPSHDDSSARPRGGQRSNDGQHAGGGQRSAPRPPRDRR